jgi:hypothetical protein
MQLLLIGSLAVAIIIALPIIGGNNNVLEQPRVTVVHKNQTSPTVEELRQKAGDPAQAGVPYSPPQFGGRRMGQWI